MYRSSDSFYNSTDSSLVTVRRLSTTLLRFTLYETLDHVPSSCIVVLVQEVKGRQYSTDASASCSIAEMSEVESETDSQPR